MADQRRYAVVGTGARASMYIEALAGEYPGEIVAWCDPNGVRMSFYDEVLAAAGRRHRYVA
jgi:predicted dehydrogenase